MAKNILYNFLLSVILIAIGGAFMWAIFSIDLLYCLAICTALCMVIFGYEYYAKHSEQYYEPIIDDLEGSLAEAKADNTRLEDIANGLASILQRNESLHEAAVTSLSNEMAKHKAELASAAALSEATIAELKDKCAEYNTLYQDLRKDKAQSPELFEANEQIRKMQEQLATLKAENSSLHDEVDKANASLGLHSIETEKLRRELKDTKERLALFEQAYGVTPSVLKNKKKTPVGASLFPK